MIRLSLFIINFLLLGQILEARPTSGSALSRPTDTILRHSRRRNSSSPEPVTVHYFQQRIDHPRGKFSGKFKQRYWLNAQSYRRGGPIFLVTGGETNGEDVVPLIENGTIQVYTDVLQGASIVLEHRYFGKSCPYQYQDLSEKHLKHLTIQQAIDDLAYFAKNVELNLGAPGSSKSSSHPDNTPWVIVGNGYAGALTNWVMLQHEGLFAVGYASSAPVQAQEDLWQYWDVIRRKMPKECSSAVQAVSEYIDKVAADEDEQEEEELKRLLGLDAVTHMVDVANSVTFSLQLWDELEPHAVDESLFIQFCDTLTASGAGKSKLHATLAAWGEWNRKRFRRNDDEYWGSYDKNHGVYLADRQWVWLLCNELGWFATAAPEGHPTLVPRLLDVQNERRMCSLHFPETFKKLVGPRVDETNSIFGGWNKHAKKLIATTGAHDAWAEVSFSARDAKKFNSDERPLVVVKKGFMSSELFFSSPTVRAAQEQVDSYLAEELEKWRPKKPSSSWRSWWSKLKEKLAKKGSGKSEEGLRA